jgi:hypothetical protein
MPIPTNYDNVDHPESFASPRVGIARSCNGVQHITATYSVTGISGTVVFALEGTHEKDPNSLNWVRLSDRSITANGNDFFDAGANAKWEWVRLNYISGTGAIATNIKLSW